MTQPLFEQYKDALRRGHAALLDGRLDEAVASYSTAARLVPDRALPHTSAAAALLQLGRREDALAALDRAVALAPDDEATLRARAAALREIGRDADAAVDLERLAAILAADRRDEALRAARRAADLAPTDARRALVERLTAEPDDTGAAGTDPAVDPEQLVADAATLLASGATVDARDRLLEAVAIHRAAGRPDAALDVCLGLLEIAPGDPTVHLAIANVQLDRGWQGFASDKIRLLLQLTALTGDTQAAADVHALAAERLRDDPGLVAAAS
ncbi:MAG TPA: BTAD domain-containing putative transcriptional regulator [Candidatus Deferrimicrobiaceae bacterium]|nr:BTAD domain-containing putative transcriptional regulator [Candidatus Deferrimicrobiaceae bacterium]